MLHLRLKERDGTVGIQVTVQVASKMGLLDGLCMLGKACLTAIHCKHCYCGQDVGVDLTIKLRHARASSLPGRLAVARRCMQAMS